MVYRSTKNCSYIVWCTVRAHLTYISDNFQKNIGQKEGKVNRTGPKIVSRGHNKGSKWLKLSLIFSLHVILGTEPKFHNKTTLILLCH